MLRIVRNTGSAVQLCHNYNLLPVSNKRKNSYMLVMLCKIEKIFGITVWL